MAKLGVWKPQVRLLAVDRPSGLWSSIPEYLGRTKVILSDFAAGRAQLNILGSQAPDAALRGQLTYVGYSPEAKAAATLQPEDGQ